MPYCVYWYGKKNSQDSYSLVRQTNFVPWKEATKKMIKHSKNPEKKLFEGQKLSREDRKRIRSMIELCEDLSKAPEDRARGDVDFLAHAMNHSQSMIWRNSPPPMNLPILIVTIMWHVPRCQLRSAPVVKRSENVILTIMRNVLGCHLRSSLIKQEAKNGKGFIIGKTRYLGSIWMEKTKRSFQTSVDCSESIWANWVFQIGQFNPALILSPYQVPPGPTRNLWMDMSHKSVSWVLSYRCKKMNVPLTKWRT